jgi:hypothetical protein
MQGDGSADKDRSHAFSGIEEEREQAEAGRYSRDVRTPNVAAAGGSDIDSAKDPQQN